MSALPEGFVLDQPAPEQQPKPSSMSALPEGFVLDQPAPEQQQQPKPSNAPMSSKELVALNERRLLSTPSFYEPKEGEEPGLLAKTADFFTGGLRTTEELEGLPGVETAEEMSMLPWDMTGFFLASDPKEQKEMIAKQTPQAKFREDAKGNTIVSYPSGDYALQKPGIEERDILRVIAKEAIYGPAAKLKSITTAIAGAGLTEGILQGIEKTAGGFFDETEVFLAGGMAAAGKTVENIVSAVDRFRRGTPSEKIKDVISRGEEEGVPVLTTDVVPPETWVGKAARSWSEKIPFAGTGPVRSDQQSAREDLVSRFTAGLAPKYDDIVQSLKTSVKATKREAGDVLEDIKVRMNPAGNIRTDTTIRAIDKELARLKNPQATPDSETINALEEIKTRFTEEGQTFELMDESRTKFRENLIGTTRNAMPTGGEALYKRVYDSMSKDLRSSVYNTLGGEDAAKWWKNKGVWANEAETLKNTALKNVLEKGDIVPEKVKPILMSKNKSARDALYTRLTPEGRSAARSTMLHDIVEKANKAKAGLSPDSLATELRRNKDQIDSFFKGDDKKSLDGFMDLLQYTRRGQEGAVELQTGQQLIPAVFGGAAVLDAGTTIGGAFTVGTIARIYESKPVRDALVKIRSVRGDDRNLALRAAFDMVLETSQTVRSELNEDENQ